MKISMETPYLKEKLKLLLEKNEGLEDWDNNVNITLLYHTFGRIYSEEGFWCTSFPAWDILEKLIHFYPLTKPVVMKELEEYVDEVIFKPSDEKSYFGECRKNKDNTGFLITVFNNYNFSEQKKILIHEIGHIYFRVQGYNMYGLRRGKNNEAVIRLFHNDEFLKIEDLLTKEAERFVGENDEFMTDLMLQLDSRNASNLLVGKS